MKSLWQTPVRLSVFTGKVSFSILTLKQTLQFARGDRAII